jgi:outer membrane receptor protein involved in Fe transport
VNSEINGKISSDFKWSARLAYTWQQALDVTDPSGTVYKDEIPYTPDQSGSGMAAVYYRIWSAGYSILFSGERYTLGENDPTNLLSGWNEQDVFVSAQILFKNCQSTIKGEVYNIFDQRYDVIHYYPMPGRSYKIGITINNL